MTFRSHLGAFWSRLRAVVAPGDPKGDQASPKSDFGHILGSWWEPSGSTFGVIVFQNFEIGGIMSTFRCPFSGIRKRSEHGAPGGGGGMRSAHAGVCFVRASPCHVGSILGSILESFREPSSPLYSVLVALVAKTRSQKRG